MKIVTRMCTSLNGCVSNADGLPVQLSDPEWDPEAFGFVELQSRCEAVLMGSTTFTPALGADRWPWEGLDVFVVGSERPADAPDRVVVDGDPSRLLERIREANNGGDVHLVGGPTTIETFRALGALDELGLVVLPILVDGGMQLTPTVKVEGRLERTRVKELPRGAVELTYEGA